MVTAWCLLIPCGMIFNGFFKQWFVNGLKFMHRDIWFLAHFFCMILALFLHLASIIVMLFHTGLTPIKSWTAGENPHVILGLATSIFFFIQLLVAFARPKPRSEKRRIFNYFHIGNATLVQILAGITLLFAAMLPGIGMPDWAKYVAVGNLVVGGFVRASVFIQRRYKKSWISVYQKPYLIFSVLLIALVFAGFGLFVSVIMQMVV